MKHQAGGHSNKNYIELLRNTDAVAIRALSKKIKPDIRRLVVTAKLTEQDTEELMNDAIVITPSQEMLPYHSLLTKIPNFSIPENDTRFYKKGQTSKPLNLTTRDGRSFKVGASLCFEQWYPSHWAALARNGADFYVHIAGEGWNSRSGQWEDAGLVEELILLFET